MAKNRIPKKIAGVKVPKALRKNSLIKSLLGSATGRRIVADALVAAASAAASVLMARSDKVQKTGAAIADAGDDATKVAKRALKSAAGAITDSLSNAAKAALGDEAGTQRRGARPH